MAPRLRLFTMTLVAVAAASLAGAQSAGAATITVTRFDDPAGGVCGMTCSLRQAVALANSDVGPDTIELPAGTYTLDPALGTLGITKSMAIVGTGAKSTNTDIAGGGAFS